MVASEFTVFRQSEMRSAGATPEGGIAVVMRAGLPTSALELKGISLPPTNFQLC